MTHLPSITLVGTKGLIVLHNYLLGGDYIVHLSKRITSEYMSGVVRGVQIDGC